jgi:hypothetical protein
MARWERDPKIRRNAALGIAAAEVAALTLNFYLIFSAYVYQINLRLGPGEGQLAVEGVAALAVAIFATVLALGVGVLLGLVYVRGGGWTRWLFIAANIILICLGAVWFLKNRASGSGPDPYATLAGLMLPICTLFPILWPLLVFHPGGPKGPAEGP